MLFLALAVTGIIYIKTSASGINLCTLNLALGMCLFFDFGALFVGAFFWFGFGVGVFVCVGFFFFWWIFFVACFNFVLF